MSDYEAIGLRLRPLLHEFVKFPDGYVLENIRWPWLRRPRSHLHARRLVKRIFRHPRTF